MVHFTSRTRCLSKRFNDNLQKWRLANHSVYLHDEDAMNRLMFKKWDLFPHLQEVMKCIGSGAEKVSYMCVSKIILNDELLFLVPKRLIFGGIY